MPSRLLSRCSSMSLICLCLWSTLAFLWCSTTADAFITPAKLNHKSPGRSRESFTSRKLILSESLCPEIKRVRNSNIYSTSMSLRSISSTSTANSRSSTDRSTSLSSSETDSTLDDNDFISDEIQSALDEALGEVYNSILDSEVATISQSCFYKCANHHITIVTSINCPNFDYLLWKSNGNWYYW